MELCLQITEYLPLPYLEAFATLSPQCAQAANVEFRRGGASFEAVKYRIQNLGEGYPQFNKRKIIGRFWYRLEPNSICRWPSWEFQAVDQHGDKAVVRLGYGYSESISNDTKEGDKDLTFGVGVKWCGPPCLGK